MHPALRHVSHRPWPLPSGPWLVQQRWNDLLFAHWQVPYEQLRPLVPSQLTLDAHQGKCWVTIAPFHMSGIRGRRMPPIPGASAVPELNVRTYVTCDGKSGVYFFSLDAASRLAVWGARTFYKLPYFFSRMSVEERDGWIHYNSLRTSSSAEFRGRYRPARAVELREPGSIEHWLTERYCLYTVAAGTVFRCDVHHERWPLQDAEAEIQMNTMAAAAGLTLPAREPLLHFSKSIEVVTWPLEKA
ncbi:MAG TPA: DUF2071 domain-containing protein [Terriglobales bacterium]|nr:DUF2071 domain-containing protein [Terriglobales bacterium]